MVARQIVRQACLFVLLNFAVAGAGADASAPAPADLLTPGTLSTAARNPPSSTAVCSFNLQGAPSSSKTVSTASIDTTSVGVALRTADIECTGGSENITIQGGPALESFSSKWKGVSYVKNTQLPGSTMTLRGVEMVVQDSNFVGLQSFGSAAIVFAASNVTFINATFLLNNNSAAGCIYANESSFVTILDSNFTTNAGLAAGSVALWNSSISMNNTHFSNNTCNSQGGAIMVYNGTDLYLSQNTFARNNATNGGAVYLERCSSVNVSQNVFTANTASKSGGAFFQLQCPDWQLCIAGSFSSNTFESNSGANGGAIWHNNLKKVSHSLNLFVGNSGRNGSGGIELNQVDTLTVNNCNFTGGRGSKGGAIYTQNTAGDITLTYFAKNNVSTSGGAIFRGTSTGNIKACNFVNNYAAVDGGAIYDSHVQGDITSDNSFSKNSAGGKGSSVFRTASSGDVEGTGLDSSAVRAKLYF